MKQEMLVNFEHKKNATSDEVAFTVKKVFWKKLVFVLLNKEVTITFINTSIELIP